MEDKTDDLLVVGIPAQGTFQNNCTTVELSKNMDNRHCVRLRRSQTEAIRRETARFVLMQGVKTGKILHEF